MVAEDRDALEELVEGTRGCGLHLAAAAVTVTPADHSAAALLEELAFPHAQPITRRVIMRPHSAPLQPLNCGELSTRVQRRLQRARKLMGDLPALQQGLDGHVDRLRGSYNWAVEKPTQPDAEVLVYRADVDDTPRDNIRWVGVCVCVCCAVRRVWAVGVPSRGLSVLGHPVFEGGGGDGCTVAVCGSNGSIMNHATAQMNHTLAHQAAFHQHLTAAPLSSPLLKRCREFTRQRCEGS